MTKKQEREAIYQKYDGHCAYCGGELEKGWHIDHLKPVVREFEITQTGIKYTGKLEFPENDTFENKMPSCPSCNRLKSSMQLETFRTIIFGMVNPLNKYHTQYQVAKRYGLVKETEIEIIFYFEKVDRSML